MYNTHHEYFIALPSYAKTIFKWFECITNIIRSVLVFMSNPKFTILVSPKFILYRFP